MHAAYWRFLQIRQVTEKIDGAPTKDDDAEHPFVESNCLRSGDYQNLSSVDEAKDICGGHHLL